MSLRSFYYTKKVFDTITYSRKELCEFQERRLKKILDTCETLPFYRDKWSSDLEYNLDSITNLPLIDGTLLRKQKEQMNDLQAEKAVRYSSGSDGDRTRVIFNVQADDWISAIYVRTLYLHGYRPRQQIVKYGEEPSERRRIGEFFIPIKYADPSMSLEEQAELLNKHEPEVIDYFPQVLLSLCKYIRNNDISLDINPKMIITRGELLTPSTRHYIEETFGCEIRDQYASTEFGTIGWECPDGGYHLVEDSVYAEVCDEEGEPVDPDEQGQIIVTGLINTATPLVHYMIGDIVELSEKSCSCNTQFKKIERIRGRKENVFRNAKDQKIYPDQLVDIMAPYENILFYRIIAEDDKYRLQYVTGENTDTSDINQCAEDLRSEISLKPLELEEIKKIPQSSGGKLKIIENKQQPL